MGVGLGRYFPVADRVNDRILVSTKSLDLMADSYHNPTALKSTLNRALKQLDTIEELFDKAPNLLRRRDSTLRGTDYDKKALEIILPDVIISEEVYNALLEFEKEAKNLGIEVWYCITK